MYSRNSTCNGKDNISSSSIGAVKSGSRNDCSNSNSNGIVVVVVMVIVAVVLGTRHEHYQTMRIVNFDLLVTSFTIVTLDSVILR